MVQLNPAERPLLLTGTSVAVPFVTGTLALLLSCFPRVSPAEIRSAVLHGSARATGRRSVVPPLLNAWAAYENLDRTGPDRSMTVSVAAGQACDGNSVSGATFEAIEM
ncbi:S8 family serine peptidase [Kitasatospora sp. NPDC051170]|uniref:S8 family serine peptidase n=1 Tax=Kitasatospora sp. NPDC051170 TaxID=3364056 RepID=UPI0037AF0A19